MTVGLSIAVFGGAHDSNVAFATDERVLLVLEAERYLRRKHGRANAIELEQLLDMGLDYCRRYLGAANEVSEIYVARWLNPFGDSIEVDGVCRRYAETGHHEGHIGSLVPLFQDCVKFMALIADGGSEDGCAALYLVSNTSGSLQFEKMESLDDTPVTGRVFANLSRLTIPGNWWTSHLEGPGKFMALAAYGEQAADVTDWLDKSWEILTDLKFERIDEARAQLRLKGYELDARAKNVAFSCAEWWMAKAAEVIKKAAAAGLPVGFAGGCAMNVVLVGRLRAAGIDVRVPPTASDPGQALGVLLVRNPERICDYPFLGLGPASLLESHQLAEQLAEDIMYGRVVGWLDGRAELGPRALGHRSILASPRTNRLMQRVSVDIKQRERYRPLAAMVRASDVEHYFVAAGDEPYMTASFAATELARQHTPGIVHEDGYSRIQTVTPSTLPTIARAMDFLAEAGHPGVVINTSLNGRGEPIAADVSDAIGLLRPGGLDCLYVQGRRMTS